MHINCFWGIKKSNSLAYMNAIYARELTAYLMEINKSINLQKKF